MAIRNTRLGGTDINFDETNFESEDYNDTNNALADLSVGIAQGAYQTLQANNVFENKDFLAVDEFTDVNGVKNTVNTTNSSGSYNTSQFYTISNTQDVDSDTTTSSNTFTNESNAFDGDKTTSASYIWTATSNGEDTTIYLGKTFTSKYIKICHVECGVSFEDRENGHESSLTLQKYDGVSWSNVYQFFYDTGSGASSVSVSTVVDIDDTIEGLRLICEGSGDDTGDTITMTTKVLAYGNYDSSGTVVCGSGIKTLDGTEKTICVYADKTVPTNTTLTVDISDGTTTLSSQPVNESIGISSLSSGTLELTFNLSTTDTLVTPELKGYGVFIK